MALFMFSEIPFRVIQTKMTFSFNHKERKERKEIKKIAREQAHFTIASPVNIRYDLASISYCFFFV
jgi:hypothetical protein